MATERGKKGDEGRVWRKKQVLSRGAAPDGCSFSCVFFSSRAVGRDESRVEW